MTYEELVQFRESVAAPVMKRLLDNTELVEGACFIDRLSLSYLDGRSWGVECVFTASGLVFEGGQVKPFVHSLEDVSFGEFLQGLDGCPLISSGHVFVQNELMELDLKTTIRCASGLVPLIQDLDLLRSLEWCSETPEYIKMCYLFQEEEKQKSVDGLISDAEQRIVGDDKSCADFERDLPL